MSALPVASWRMIKEQEQELQTMLLWESEIPEGKKKIFVKSFGARVSFTNLVLQQTRIQE